MKKQVRCINCNSRLFDVHNEPAPVGIIAIKCRKCGSLSLIDITII